MKDLLWLTRKTILSVLRKKVNILILFVLPIAAALVSMAIYGGGSGAPLRVTLVNLDGEHKITQDTISFLQQLNKVQITVTDEETMKKDIAAGSSDTSVVFKQGFAASVQKGAPDHIEMISVKGAEVTAYVKSMLHSYISNVAALGKYAAGDQEVFMSLYEDYSTQRFKLSSVKVEDTAAVKNATYQTIGFLVALMMFSSANLTSFILKEKENRTFFRIMASPISSKTYVLSNVIVNFIMLFVQIIITVFFMKQVLHIDSGIPAIQFVIIMMLFGLTAIGLALLIISFAKGARMAGALQNLIITPSCLIAGCYFPLEIIPESFRQLSGFMPQYWLLETVNKLQNGASLAGLYLNLLTLIGFAAALTLVAIYNFSRNNDTRTFI
ncbi:ABC transporter permease [Paenibacillus shunpengii]|uniref:Transport permease protein n=1 Tax=Paenibacillus shunpengii TaxID=2054424 RepID=A0ABW5SMA7_9BACL